MQEQTDMLAYSLWTVIRLDSHMTIEFWKENAFPDDGLKISWLKHVISSCVSDTVINSCVNNTVFLCSVSQNGDAFSKN